MCTNADNGCVFSLTYILIVRIICGAIYYVNKIFFFSKVLICDSITPLIPSGILLNPLCQQDEIVSLVKKVSLYFITK